MSATAYIAAPAQTPELRQERAVARTLRLLSLVRTLIAFGKQLADSSAPIPLPKPPWTPPYASARKTWRSSSPASHAVSDSAAALETKLVDRAAHPLPARAARESSARKPRAKPPAPQPDASAVLAALPTSEEIADQLRRRPVHAVLIDICSDLGIVTADPMYPNCSTPSSRTAVASSPFTRTSKSGPA